MRKMIAVVTTALLVGFMAPAGAAPPALDSLWDDEHPARSEQAFVKLLPAAKRAGDGAYRLEILTQIARAQGLQQHFAEAQRTLEQVQRQLSPKQPRVKVRYWLERGRVFNSAGRPDQARPLFLAAWELARTAHQDELAVDAAHMLGLVEKGEQALAWDRQAIAFAEQSPSPRARKWLASLYHNTGWTLHDMGQYEQALELFQQGLQARQESGQVAEIRIARWSVARALRSLKRLDEALVLQRALEQELAILGESDGYVFEELAEILWIQGKSVDARLYFLKAHALLARDSWLVQHEPRRLARLKELGESF